MGLLDKFIMAAIKAVNSNSKQLEDLQRAQFDSGKDYKGKERKPYSPVTVRYKRAKGQPTNRVTLKDTGESYIDTKVTADYQGITIDVPTDYFKYMVKKYGEDTIGISSEALKDYFENHIFTAIRNEFARSDIS